VDPRDRLFGPVSSVPDPDTDVLVVDYGDLVRKLILSEELVLESNRLREIPLLVEKFGYEGVSELLRSGRVRILGEVPAMGFPQPDTIHPQRQGRSLTVGPYSFGVVRQHDLEAFTHENLQAIEETPGLTEKEARKLRGLVVATLITPAENRGEPALDQLTKDLESNASIIKTSVALASCQQYGRQIRPEGFDLTVERIDETYWRVVTTLGDRTGLSDLRVYRVVGHGLLGVGGLNRRLEHMERYSAVTGFQENELSLVEEKLGYLARLVDPEAQVDRFEKVIELAGLPDVDPRTEVQDVDMARLLEVLDDDEIKEFRRWLRGIDSLDDKDVKAEIHRLRDRMAHAIRSDAGKGVRLFITTGVGVAVPPVGVALSAIDTFLTDKIVPEPGPTAFVSQLYPSIFRR
jgi:hypothetical protein